MKTYTAPGFWRPRPWPRLALALVRWSESPMAHGGPLPCPPVADYGPDWWRFGGKARYACLSFPRTRGRGGVVADCFALILGNAYFCNDILAFSPIGESLFLVAR